MERKEAIEIIKKNYPDSSFTMLREALETLIPELKESEGERIIQYFKDLAPFDKADELYEKYGFSHKDAIAWLEKRGEQKPAWSDEDEEHIMAIDVAVNRCLGKWHCCGEKCPISEHNPWLKSLKDRVQPQPKQEWSEEDEKMLRTIISDGIRGAEFDKAQIDWLKFLKDRYAWKPSDKQMKQLGWVAEQNKDNMIGEELMTLYQDLKKLREE